MSNKAASEVGSKDQAAETAHTTPANGDTAGASSDTKKKTNGMAADAAVQRLLSRLGLGGGPAPTEDVVVTNGAGGGGAKGEAVSDTDVEALSPHDQEVFAAQVAKASDPTLLAAVDAAGGMVGFMKAMASGQTVGGINEAKFEQLWANSVDESWLKDKFRAVDPGKHEWIPSNEIEAVVQRAKTAPEGGTWIDLQNELRSDTNTVIFDPSAITVDATDGKGLLLQGHVGALYLNGVMQTKDEAQFHDELRAAYAASKAIPDCIDALKTVMTKWMWKGEPLPKPLHPGLQDSMNQPINEGTMESQRASVYQAMAASFDAMKSKLAGASSK